MDLIGEWRQAVRALARAPGLVLSAVAVLALGLGANVALFAVLRAVVLAELPYRDSERLVMVSESFPEEGLERREVSPARLRLWRDRSETLAELAAYIPWAERTLSGAGEAETVNVLPVTPGFLSFLGYVPALGRDLEEADESEERRVAVLSWDLWQRKLDGDPAALGRSVRLHGEEYTVIGVLPRELRIGGLLPLDAPTTGGAEVLVPVRGVLWAADGYGVFRVLGRLTHGATPAAARAELETLGDGAGGVRVEPLRVLVAGRYRPVLWLLWAGVSIVLLIACANLAGVLLARGFSQRRELAVRAALGASWWSLARALVWEASALVALGALAAGLLAGPLSRAFVELAPSALPRLETIRADAGVLTYTIAPAVIALAVLVGPVAVFAARSSGSEVLRLHVRAQRLRGRQLLLVLQVALATSLLAAALLVGRSLQRLVAVDVGFDAGRVLTARVDLPLSRFASGADRAEMVERLLAALEALPTVEAVGAVNQAPLGNVSDRFRVWLPTSSSDPSRPAATVQIRTVAGNYLEALGLPLLQGAWPRAAAGAGCVVSESLARALWPNQSALDGRVSVDGPQGPWMDVVGVVADVRFAGPSAQPAAELYVPYTAVPWPSVVLAVRSEAPAALVEPVANAVRAVDPELSLYDVATLAAKLDAITAPERLSTRLLGLFGLAAVVTASLGTYGLLTYSVARRRHELGVRLAVGATSSDLVRLVVGRGLLPVVAGVAIGTSAAALAARAAGTFLLAVEPADPVALIGPAVILISSSSVAALRPGISAVRRDPLQALRSE